MEIHLISGKGGVGKTNIALSLAYHLSQNLKKRCLLVELINRSQVSDIFSAPDATYHPLEVADNLFLAKWSGQNCLREYVVHFVKSQKLYDLFFDNPVTKALIEIAPGLAEIAILGKLTSTIRKVGPKMNFDAIVLDAHSTGHFLSLLSAPIALAQIIPKGPMSEHCRAILATLRDPQICKIHVVTLPEELPIIETLEFLDKLSKILPQSPSVIINQSLFPYTADISATIENPQIKVLSQHYQMALKNENQMTAPLLKNDSIKAKRFPKIFKHNPLDKAITLSQCWNGSTPG